VGFLWTKNTSYTNANSCPQLSGVRYQPANFRSCELLGLSKVGGDNLSNKDSPGFFMSKLQGFFSRKKEDVGSVFLLKGWKPNNELVFQSTKMD